MPLFIFNTITTCTFIVALKTCQRDWKYLLLFSPSLANVNVECLASLILWLESLETVWLETYNCSYWYKPSRGIKYPGEM